MNYIDYEFETKESKIFFTALTNPNLICETLNRTDLTQKDINTHLQALLHSSCSDLVLDTAKKYFDHESPTIRLSSLSIAMKFPKTDELKELLTQFVSDPVFSIRENAFSFLGKY